VIRCASVAFLSLALPAGAATIHVPGDQPTIRAGLDAAVAGDVVLVACGEYEEGDLQMTSGVTLRGRRGRRAA